MRLTHHRPKLYIQPADGTEERAKRMTELRDFSKELSGQALALLPFQAVLALTLAASITKGHLHAIVATASVGLLAASLASTGVVLSRVHSRPIWTVEDTDALIKEEAKAVNEKGFTLWIGSWVLLAATGAVALTAILSLSGS
jgi:hypothetical protein